MQRSLEVEVLYPTCIRQALDRALTQKQTSAQATAARMGQLEHRLTEILQAESQLVDLKKRLQANNINR